MFDSPAPVPLSSVLRLKVSTLHERPFMRPNDRFLERFPTHPLGWRHRVLAHLSAARKA